MSDNMQLFSLAPSPVKLDNGNTVYVRRLNGLQRITWLEYLDKQPQDQSLAQALDSTAKLVALCACKENGERIFGDDDEAAVKLHLDHITLDRLSAEAMYINGFSKSGSDDAEKK